MIKRTKIRSNGITLLSEQNQSAGSVTAALFFKSGILSEKEREYGVTRFVQELLYRDCLSRLPDGCAGQKHGRDHAAFLCHTQPEKAAETIQTLAGLTDVTSFSDGMIEAVRADLLRECAAFVPSREDEVEQLYFGLPSYRTPPCGTEQTLRSLTQDQLQRRREQYFTRANACFILTGNFTDDQLKTVTAFLRSLPPQKHKSLNLKPQFPPAQFFRTSADDRFLPAEEDDTGMELLFEIDLCETKPVWAAMLRRLLAEPGTGALPKALKSARLTCDLQSQLRIYQGFAVLRLSCAVPQDRLADAVTRLTNAIASCKENLSEEEVLPLIPYYTENRLYQFTEGADRAYELGLHNFILYTDDIVLPEQHSEDAVMEQLTEAADNVLIPDNALFLIRYHEKSSADLSAIRQSVTAARIRLFL